MIVAVGELPLRPLVYGLAAYCFTQLSLPKGLQPLQLTHSSKLVVSAALAVGAVEGVLGLVLGWEDDDTDSTPVRIPDRSRFALTIPLSLLFLGIGSLVVQRSLNYRAWLKDGFQIGVGAAVIFPTLGLLVSGARRVWPNPCLGVSEEHGNGDLVFKKCPGRDCQEIYDTNRAAAVKYVVAALVSGVAASLVLSKALPVIPARMWMAGALFSPVAVVGQARAMWEGKEGKEVQAGDLLINGVGVGLASLAVYLISQQWGPALGAHEIAGVALLGYAASRVLDQFAAALVRDAYRSWPQLASEPKREAKGGCEKGCGVFDDKRSAAQKERVLRPIIYSLAALLLTNIPFPKALGALALSSSTQAVVSAALLAGLADGVLGIELAERDKRINEGIRFLATVPLATVAVAVTTLFSPTALTGLSILRDGAVLGFGSLIVYSAAGWASALKPRPYFEDEEQKWRTEPCDKCGWDKADGYRLAAVKYLAIALGGALAAPLLLNRIVPSVPLRVWIAGAAFSPFAIALPALTVASCTDYWKRDDEGAVPAIVNPYIQGLGLGLAVLSVYLASRKWTPSLDFPKAAAVALAGYGGARVLDWALLNGADHLYAAWPHLPKGNAPRPPQQVVGLASLGPSDEE
ncbi:MAG: hypothetical protein AB7F31_00355 [Parachlamydiales bacterium]